MKRRAFTLVEIMIVVLIIGILIAIAVPNFLRSRSVSWQKACQSNLRRISDSKEQWSMENRKDIGDPCTLVEIVPDYIRANLICPAGGNYDPQPVGTVPTCDFVNPANPHTSP